MDGFGFNKTKNKPKQKQPNVVLCHCSLGINDINDSNKIWEPETRGLQPQDMTNLYTARSSKKWLMYTSEVTFIPSTTISKC